MSSRFDPRPHLRELENGAPYLDVKWRLHWLRTEHPDARIETQLLPTDGETIVCKATVTLSDGGSASGHASASRTPSASHIEQAETRAIGRALAALGYGTEYTEDDIVHARSSERPVSLVPSQPAVSQRPDRPERPERIDRLESDEQEPTQLAPSGRVRSMRPEPDVADETSIRPARAPRELRESDPDTVVEMPPMGRASDLRRREEPKTADAATDTPQTAAEDISWSKFWPWAKRRGYRDANHLRELLGIDVNALTPAEVRERIRRHELDNPPPGSDE